MGRWGCWVDERIDTTLRLQVSERSENTNDTMPERFRRSEINKQIQWLMIQHILVGRSAREVAGWFFCSERTVRRAAMRFMTKGCMVDQTRGKRIGRPRKYNRTALNVSKTISL